MEKMNVSKWNAYNLAVLMSLDYPNGFSAEALKGEISANLGTDKRTVQKYRTLMSVNNYVITNEKSSKFNEALIVNPNIADMKPKSLKQLISEKQRVKN